MLEGEGGGKGISDVMAEVEMGEIASSLALAMVSCPRSRRRAKSSNIKSSLGNSKGLQSKHECY